MRGSRGLAYTVNVHNPLDSWAFYLEPNCPHLFPVYSLCKAVNFICPFLFNQFFWRVVFPHIGFTCASNAGVMVSGLLKGQFTQITKTCFLCYYTWSLLDREKWMRYFHRHPPKSRVDQSYLGCIGKHHRNQSEVQAALLDVLILNLCRVKR